MKFNWIIFSLLSLLILIPEMAMAEEAFSNVGETACNILKALNGKVARTIATFAIVFLGIGAFFGKLNWGSVLTIAIGIIFVFGAGAIAEVMFKSSGGTDEANCDTATKKD